MKGVRFYLEYDNPRDKRLNKNNGNVSAIATDTGRMSDYFSGGYGYDSVGAVYHRPNSPVASTSISIYWLRNCCKRISEKQAREIHPELFVYLDWEGD